MIEISECVQVRMYDVLSRKLVRAYTYFVWKLLVFIVLLLVEIDILIIMYMYL